jgi:hypothetical protein
MRLIMKPFKFAASIMNVDSKWLKQIQTNFAFHILNFLILAIFLGFLHLYHSTQLVIHLKYIKLKLKVQS